ncbi:MAG TPA: tyrosine--tRNA ligase [Methanomicrobia archaeon]|nr:tyrosine--tRNA ligase [Methanomicrobia archaeon]
MEERDTLRSLELNVEEIITREEFEALLAGKSERQPRAYVGIEPSGNVHLGHLPFLNTLRILQRNGVHIVVLLADLHAYLNEKGEFEQIRATAEYNRRCFAASGLTAETEFVYGRDYQLEEEYMLNVLRLATITTEKRARRSMDEVSRSKEDRKVSQTIYPLMQAMDISYLNIDIAIGGIDQRKIHMLARDNLPKLGFKAPVCIHTPLLIGLDGEKMSSSKQNFIAIDEPDESVAQKLKSAFCPPNVADGNPVLQIYKHTIFPNPDRKDEVTIQRPEKYGGNVGYERYEALERDYVAGMLHPSDLKLNAVRSLNEVLEPIRQRMQ